MVCIFQICKHRIYLVRVLSRTIQLRILGARLWRARLRAGVHQEAAAAALERHQSTISRLEQGGRQVRAQEVFALAALYGVKAEELIGPFTPEEEFLEQELRKDINFDHPMLPRRQMNRL
jgi:transcriptional regulator with XRE-family HTH domain